ncbi:YbfB/YjiJ family MFS transporter [Streptomyces sp. NPDC005374]|uniref:YbfB/YjiJ family MFS transporter n=1 Tax=Streptomyces sp. NPDC005374 TaxID=3364713 RepID=UPI0036CAB7B1
MSTASPWMHVARAAVALAAGMGVGRFVYTPILPLMQTHAGLSAAAGADLATANYVGYLLGALAGILVPALVRSRTVLRGSLIVLTATLAGMPLTHSTTVWAVLRLVAGVASALVFVVAAGSLLQHLRTHPPHLAGWAFGGVGAGIALSGLLVLALRTAADWRAAWWASAALAAVLTAGAWTLRPQEATSGPDPEVGKRAQRWFWALFVGYTLEGAGYIVAGTFLVAAIGQNSPGRVGGAAWVLVGLAAVPSTALWARLAHRWSRPGLLVAALLIQAAGIALPALVGGTAAASASAVLFGGTFLGICTLALATGAQLRFPRSVAVLTAGYSVGQILGPPAVAPLLHDGYRSALLLAALVVLASAAAAVVLRIGFPHRMVIVDGSRRESTEDARSGYSAPGALAPHSAD